MKCPPVLATEPERLQALAEYGLGPDRPLPSLEPVVQIAARMFDVPVSVVNMIGSDHVFFAASVGMDSAEVDLSRDVSFCAHAITQEEVMVVPDARLDERFHDNPLVTGSASLRFYAGVALRSPQGHALGTLCVIDGKPNYNFSPEDRERLRELARMASDRLELRRMDLFQLVHIDRLTGLANRMGLYQRIDEALTNRAGTALLLIDLDGFKDVNDTLGHEVGDGILREIACRLGREANPDDMVARVGNDEFAILLPGATTSEQAIGIASRAIARVAEPIAIGGHEVRMTASCGIAVAPIHAQEALALASDAELALFKAKQMRRGQIFVFVAALRTEAASRQQYNTELHRAVSDGEFVLFYQPQVRLADGALIGAEALIRWRHPQRGLLSPAAFLPALESGPLAPVVGAWVLDAACAQAACWREQGLKDFRMGVNLFGAQLSADDFVEQVADTLKRHDLPPQMLELEVTENIVLHHDDVVVDTLRRLRDLGVSIAFDDFGTGYASLSLLKHYPLNRLKIDQSFVRGMLESDQDASVIRAILDMADSFGLRTIAEGIEEEPQRSRLHRFGCEEGQGYLFGRPVCVAEFSGLLEAQG